MGDVANRNATASFLENENSRGIICARGDKTAITILR